MTQNSRIEHARQVVADSFHRMGAPPDQPVRETLLIRDGAYCGHRFRMGNLHAVWFVEEDQLKLFEADGTLGQVLCPSQVTVPSARRSAA